MSFTGQAVEEAVYKIGAVAPRLGQAGTSLWSFANFGLSAMKTGENFIGSHRKALDFHGKKHQSFRFRCSLQTIQWLVDFGHFRWVFCWCGTYGFGLDLGLDFGRCPGFFGDVGSRGETVITCFSPPTSIWKNQPRDCAFLGAPWVCFQLGKMMINNEWWALQLVGFGWILAHLLVRVPALVPIRSN